MDIKFNGKYYPVRKLLVRLKPDASLVSITVGNEELSAAARQLNKSLPEGVFACVTKEQFELSAPNLVAEMNSDWILYKEDTGGEVYGVNNERFTVQESIVAGAVRRYGNNFNVNVKNLVEYIIQQLGTGHHIDIANFVIKKIDRTPVEVKPDGHILTIDGIVYKVTVERNDEDEAIVLNE